MVGFKFYLHPLPALPPERPGELDCRLIMICSWRLSFSVNIGLQKHFKLYQIPLLLSKPQCPVIWKPVHNLNCGLANSILQLLRPDTFASTTFDILQLKKFWSFTLVLHVLNSAILNYFCTLNCICSLFCFQLTWAQYRVSLCSWHISFVINLLWSEAADGNLTCTLHCLRLSYFLVLLNLAWIIWVRKISCMLWLNFILVLSFIPPWVSFCV